MAAVPMNTKSLRNSDDQTRQSPDLPRVVVPAKKHKECDECLKHNDLIAVEEVCSRQTLLQSDTISAEHGRSILTPSLQAVFGSRACDCAIVNYKKQRLEASAACIEMCDGVEEDGLERRDMQDLHERVHILLEHLPELSRLLFWWVQRLHVHICRAVSEDEALVARRDIGGFGGLHVVFVVGRFDEDGLEIFHLHRVSYLAYPCRTFPTHLVVQARPKAVVDVAAPSLLDDEPAKAAL